MSIQELIIKTIQQKGAVTTAEIVKKTGFSKAYINRFFKELQEEGRIILIGQTNSAHYIKADKESLLKTKKKIKRFNKRIKNKDLSEDIILEEIKKKTGILLKVSSNVKNIFEYAFTEILNNAIDHSQSKEINIQVVNYNGFLRFDITDYGIGIFNNIRKIKKLKNNLEAIQELLKGKQTTAPEKHSGEGIFFTSKAADNFIISSFDKKLIFNNLIEDFFIQDIKILKGTKVTFNISLKSKKKLSDIFNQYTEKGTYQFNKTKVVIKLYKLDSIYLSRSQARRVLVNLDKFKTIILDFKNVDTIGQAFADEIFRVWNNNHPKIKIITKNANKNIAFMINRTKD